MLIGEQGHYPFGDNWYMNSTTTKEMFTTYERDPETGTGSAGTGNDYAMARYYPNRLGRFSSIDPLSGNIGVPQSLNHYAYVTNDPINMMDPTGMSEATAICGAGPAKNYVDPTCGNSDGSINFNGDGSGLINFDPTSIDGWPTAYPPTSFASPWPTCGNPEYGCPYLQPYNNEYLDKQFQAWVNGLHKISDVTGGSERRTGKAAINGVHATPAGGCQRGECS